MKFLEYLGFRKLVILISITPFPIVYFYSNCLFFILFYVFKYRRKVVIENLKNAFPNKSEIEIKKIEKSFYLHLSDITLESVKSMSISEKTLNKRYKVLNADLANSYFNQGKSIICLTSHYGNWEYGILATNNAIEHQAVALYLPLSNKYSESYGLKRRTRFGMNLVAIQETKSIFAKEPEKPLAIIMAADQSPSNLERAIWVDFLNQNTACLHGAEAYAKKLNIPVLYLKISKLKRGYYSLEFEKLIENPSEYKPDEITKIYMNRLEKDIIEMPEFWLWSHRRWKHKKQL